MTRHDIRPIGNRDLRRMCEDYHGYGGAGGTSTCAFGVFEGDRIVAAYSWQPPPYGAALSVCPEAPWAVLALSRMVAVPKSERVLKHVSKPLREQMNTLIDRTRWPVLITYSDEGQGHTGYVYQCSGFTPTFRALRETYTDAEGVRVSRYSNGRKAAGIDACAKGKTWLQRWEHWVVPNDRVVDYIAQGGWVREPTGRLWASGKPAFRIVQKGATP